MVSTCDRLERSALALLVLRCIPSARDGRIVITLESLDTHIVEDLGRTAIVVVVQVPTHRVSEDGSWSAVIVDFHVLDDDISITPSQSTKQNSNQIVVDIEVPVDGCTTNLAGG